MDNVVIEITFNTPTGRHTMACRTCGAPVGVKLSKVYWRNNQSAYRRVDSNTCRKCGDSHHYIVKPKVMTREEMAAWVTKRRAEKFNRVIDSGDLSEE